MSGKLKLNILDVNKKRLRDDVDILFRHTVLNLSFEVVKKDASKAINISNIDTRQGGRYVIRIFPRKHRSVFRIVQIKDDPAKNVQDFYLPVNPERVIHPIFPNHPDLASDLKDVLDRSQIETSDNKTGAALYDSLDDHRKACLLNLYSKMKETVFSNGRDAFSYVNHLTRLRGDRFFARAQKELRDEVKNSITSRLFDEVPGGQHTPPDQFKLVDSFKTFDLYGNLQLTFFANPALDFIIDTDIDDARGIGHLFQVAEHKLTSSETHPYDIHQILIYHQQLYPGYELVV